MGSADGGPETPSEPQHDLDSVLITDLDAFDSEFWQVHNRRLVWWDCDRTKAWLMFPVDAGETETSFPYAYQNVIHHPLQPSLDASAGERGIICYARDTQGRHVAIKAVVDGSEELRILKYLRTQPIASSIEEFHHVIPILDVLPCEGHWLAVMPRWGIHPLSPRFDNPQEVLQFIHCLLKDLKVDNVLINLFSGYVSDHAGSGRAPLRSQGKLTYALFDFSLSTMFPSSASLMECRLPSALSFRNYPSQRPSDTIQGELDYNPFIFDVGMLGKFLLSSFLDHRLLTGHFPSASDTRRTDACTLP
ncbi:hypothetical protein H0H93_011841 [Arthromyces matolae]|nr:hypothetical protein H0H93_011841 [Arthromyces matolae]